MLLVYIHILIFIFAAANLVQIFKSSRVAWCSKRPLCVPVIHIFLTYPLYSLPCLHVQSLVSPRNYLN